MKPHILLLPLSWLYAGVMLIRNYLFDVGKLKEQEFPIHTIGIGNITAGGTGKTPHVEYVVKRLLRKNFKVAVLSRGYGRKTKGFLLAQESHTVVDIGDETWQLKHKFPAVVFAVDENRQRGITWLRTMHPDLQVIVLDDAFQHRYVKVGLNILLCDYSRPLWRDYVLPAGYLRELRRGRSRADVIICTKSPLSMPENEKDFISNKLLVDARQKVLFTSVVNDKLYCLAEPSERFGMERLQDRPIMLLTGIATPYSLTRELERYTQVYSFAFADHHRFTARELSRVEQTAIPLRDKMPAIVTTEKDVPRLYEHPDFIKRWARRIYVMPARVVFQQTEDLFADNDELIFNDIIYGYLKQTP